MSQVVTPDSTFSADLSEMLRLTKPPRSADTPLKEGNDDGGVRYFYLTQINKNYKYVLKRIYQSGGNT